MNGLSLTGDDVNSRMIVAGVVGFIIGVVVAVAITVTVLLVYNRSAYSYVHFL